MIDANLRKAIEKVASELACHGTVVGDTFAEVFKNIINYAEHYDKQEHDKEEKFEKEFWENETRY